MYIFLLIRPVSLYAGIFFAAEENRAKIRILKFNSDLKIFALESLFKTMRLRLESY